MPFFVSFSALGLAIVAWIELRSDRRLRGRRVAAAAAVLGLVGIVLSLLVGLSFFLSL